MNQIAIAIKLNDRKMFIGATWPTIETLKAVARYKLAGIKRKIDEAALRVVMAIIPMPKCAAA